MCVYIERDSTCQELSNDMLHDNLTQLYQKLVTYSFFSIMLFVFT